MNDHFDTSSIPSEATYWDELEQRVAAAMAHGEPALHWLIRSPRGWLSGCTIVAAALALLIVRVVRVDHDAPLPQALVTVIEPDDQLGRAIVRPDAPPPLLALAAAVHTAEPETR